MKSLVQALRMFLWMTLLTGILYPLVITGIGRVAFRDRAEGSWLYADDKLIGSLWIGQLFTRAEYFWPRPSATNYNPLPSSGSNWSVTHRDLEKSLAERRERLGTMEPPSDLLYASGSGLDPHISPDAALFQLERVIHARQLSAQESAALRRLVLDTIEPPTWGFLGQPRINVLLLNRQLDQKFRR